jgi:hypothetical protein
LIAARDTFVKSAQAQNLIATRQVGTTDILWLTKPEAEHGHAGG